MGMEGIMEACGKTVLHHACYYGRAEMALWLLEQRADVHAARLEPHLQVGRKALHDAAGFRCWETCAVLLQYGPDVNAKDCNGETALHYAVKNPLPVFGCPEMRAVAEVCQTLLSGRADPNIKPLHGLTALDLFDRFPFDPDVTRTVNTLLRRHMLERELCFWRLVRKLHARVCTLRRE